jgi:hypothetical protein
VHTKEGGGALGYVGGGGGDPGEVQRVVGAGLVA